MEEERGTIEWSAHNEQGEEEYYDDVSGTKLDPNVQRNEACTQSSVQESRD